jgi:uncharacterized protein YdhG (YjbR/CyaY superfamily)
MATTRTAMAYLGKASPRFREVHASLGRAIENLFPDARSAFEYGMPGWRIPRPRRVDPASVKGTIDPNWVHVFLAERKAGITLNLWNPVDVGGFRKRKRELERAGFKVMVGCLQFNRKSEYPIGLVVELLKDIRNSLEEDGRAATPWPKSRGPAPAKGEDEEHKALLRELDEWSSEPPMDGGD